MVSEPQPDSSCSPELIQPAPLLTIAIPTWNRAATLGLLLQTLIPQIANHPEVELLICDNGSSDETSEVVARYRTPKTRYHRHHENIGSDANFVSAFDLARGDYFWICGDDDIPVPDAIEDLLQRLRVEDYDLIYATSYGYRNDWLAERQGDPLGRDAHTITDPVIFTRVVNVMFTFISGIIVNRTRLLDLARQGRAVEPPSAFIGTNLAQLAWTLPLLRDHRRSLVLWKRPIACRLGHNGGYDLARIFGAGLMDVTARLLPDRPDLALIITNTAIRRWFPSILYDIRSSGNKTFVLEDAHKVLSAAFGGNLRYWLFTYPVLSLPLPFARLWMKCGELISKAIYMLTVPRFWKRRT